MSRTLLMSLFVLAVTAILVADVPRTISYQGRLTDNGVPINGFKTVAFTIYDRSGNPIWNSGMFQTVFTEGLFTVELGRLPQPPLPDVEWALDTAMTLGVAFPPDPEVVPRLSFKTVPYAMHALTAQTVASGGSWVRNSGLISLENPNDSIGIGTTTPAAKVGINTTGSPTALRIHSESPLTLYYPATVELTSLNNTGVILRRGNSTMRPAAPLPALYAISTEENGGAGWFTGNSSYHATLYVHTNGTGSGIEMSNPYGYAIDSWGGKGIRLIADSATALRAESNYSVGMATVLSSTYTGTIAYDHVAVSGYSRPVDYYGIGGKFEGGYKGVQGEVSPEGNGIYSGVEGLVYGGTGSNYGVQGRVSGGGICTAIFGYASGIGGNIGVYGHASGGTTNWAGHFQGDVNVTGSIVKSAGNLAIDNPTDPENQYLQQAEVISNEMKAVYDGTLVLGSDGTAVVQLPDYIESFCGDFRYQLTCVGGYAPVYVSSEISGNQFSIAGGKPGLKVSWQITGIRKDRYAQANPLEVEKKKTASEQGKYLHPELYGYGADRSLNPNPEANAEMKAKDGAIRVATEALKKPSTPPAQPQTVEKK